MKQFFIALGVMCTLLLGGVLTGPQYGWAQAYTPATIDAFNTTNQNIYQTADDNLKLGYKSLRSFGYVIGGMGVVALGIMCMFGKMQFGWLFMAVGGMAIIALIDQAFQYTGGINVT